MATHSDQMYKFNLIVVTRQVVPFTPSAGVLEWVNGTVPLGEYLTGRFGLLPFAVEYNVSIRYNVFMVNKFCVLTSAPEVEAPMDATESETGHFPNAGSRWPWQVSYTWLFFSMVFLPVFYLPFQSSLSFLLKVKVLIVTPKGNRLYARR